jgi:hypothetical protein
METLTTVTYRLRGEQHVRSFVTARPVYAMLNLAPDVDLCYAVGTFQPARSKHRCCGDSNCAHEQQLRADAEALEVSA